MKKSEGIKISKEGKKGEGYIIQPQKPIADWGTSSKLDKWAEFKKVIAAQEPNVIIPYTGFPSPEELKRARNLIAKFDKDKFFQSLLNGSTLKFEANYITLTLEVMRETK
jgi:hypothetical protein